MSVSTPDIPSEIPSTRLSPGATDKPVFQGVWDLLRCFRSVQLAIVLLSLLAAGILVGVLMPQEGLVDITDIKARYGEHYRLLKAMGLFNVFSSPGFLALEVLFFFNLLLGSFQWLRPAFLSATRTDFYDVAHIQASPNHVWFDVCSDTGRSAKAAADRLSRILKKRRYGVRRHPAETLKLYASKGNFSRLGPVVAHFGILILLVASLYGAFNGFKAQKIAVPGETFALSRVDAFMPNVDRSFWLGRVPDWTVTVHDFKADFYEEAPQTARQFTADIEVRDASGQRLARREISVNHPLALEDVTFYQASYAPTGRLFLELNGTPRTVAVNTRYLDRPISLTEIAPSAGDPPGSRQSLIVFPFLVQQDPGVTRNHIRVFVHRKGAFLGAAPGRMPENLMLYEGEAGRLGNLTVTFRKPELATGLQIKKAPETFWIYLAFALIATGAVMCFFSQRQIWVAAERAGEGLRIYLHYRTNKARLSFNRELAALKAEIAQDVLTGRTQAT